MMQLLFDFFSSYGLDAGLSALFATLSAVAVALLLIIVLELGFKRVLLEMISAFALRTVTTFDDILVRRNVFSGLARLLPPIFLHILSDPLLQYYPAFVPFVKDAAVLYLTVALVMLVFSLLDAMQDFLSTRPSAARLPVKSFMQVLKALALAVALVVVVSKLMGKSPVVFLSGLGAFTAVLLLVFKDSILGLVAGVQLSANNLVRVGDWIEMPQYGADGDVIDISLVTVSVQNWDKTISTIPAYSLISQGFKNWRGMSEGGGRRIKRSVQIDMHSVRFCDEALLMQLREVRLLKGYLEEKERELSEWNSRFQDGNTSPVNARRLTNLGTFRAYLAAYLRSHPNINTSMTLIIRQLQPTAGGIPIEIYVFCREKEWAAYEGVQADIFDHVLAVLPWFELRVFQNPGGYDIERAGSRLAGALSPESRGEGAASGAL
ncbi:MAG: mechanosensitive ion channel protein MscS [Pelodictyon luteolum]|uniref:Mechanosensing system component YbdG n=1 Tax=Pelodictyon luteolum TaxID=1100 RepID=A0A165LD35_PELLU|nr:mechanosensitive ion channel domain-containing protein [Pelodictyon luteolum]KZK73872.1 MAG: mechanosensitive ion channel protein MscS [Pelodictyon luteolum]